MKMLYLALNKHPQLYWEAQELRFPESSAADVAASPLDHKYWDVVSDLSR